MKHKKIIFSLAAASMLLTACEDQVMQWQSPDPTVKPEELPLALAEKISRYDFIKNYMAQYHPGVDITVGMGLDNFLDDETYQQTVMDNFQGVTFGNALKHQSIVSNAGAYNWSTVDKFIAMNTGLKIHGHNFIWHTQQNQTYLKSLIAPTMEIVSDPQADIENRLTGDNSNFDGGTKGGWGSWGNDSQSSVVAPGRGGDGYCMLLSNPSDGSDYYVAQAAYTFDDPLAPNTYKIRFYAKSDSPAGSVQFCYQNSSTYSGGGYHAFDVGTSWTLCEYEFDLTADDMDRILINFGKVAGDYYIDDVEFGLKVEPQEPDPMQNVLFGDNSDFEGGTKGGWGSWGNDSQSSVASPGYNSDYCMLLDNPSDGSDYYVAQAAYTFDLPLVPGTYIISFYAKSNTAAGSVQFCYQNSSTYSGGGYHAFDVGTDWVPCEYEFELTADDMDRILINFGKVTGQYYIDNVKFGLKNDEAAADPMVNILPAAASNFNDNTDGSTGGWGSWGSNKDTVETQSGVGPDGSVAVVLTNNGDGNAWEAQFAYTFDDPLTQGIPYIISFDAKSTSAAGQLQFQYQNGTSYGSQGGYNTFEIGTSWLPYEYEFTIADYDDVDRIILNFGAVGATYYIDNIKFGPKIATRSYSRFVPFVSTRASQITYRIKSLEEKQAALLGAMEDWIKEAMYHVGEYASSWDVINEPIGDDISFRGIDNRGWMSGDSEPVETEEAGLQLNWANETGNGHFYWGYYLGLDYAVKAFEFARKYADEVNPDIKLFVNEYNLETNPSKLAKLIEFVNYIDANGAHVDGIGTQMHVSGTSITKEQVDEMFRTLANTGKLIRITELDVAMGTASPSVEQQQQQADVYQMILTSYFENIPESQQSAITIWSLTDNAKEHEYWLNGDTPNIFDASYGRKIAYKGVCDAIIGFDPSEDWGSVDWSKEN